MADRLSAVLQRFELHARVFHGDPLCGVTDFDGQHGVGHLHLLRNGSLGVTAVPMRNTTPCHAS